VPQGEILLPIPAADTDANPAFRRNNRSQKSTKISSGQSLTVAARIRERIGKLNRGIDSDRVCQPEPRLEDCQRCRCRPLVFFPGNGNSAGFSGCGCHVSALYSVLLSSNGQPCGGVVCPVRLTMRALARIVSAVVVAVTGPVVPASARFPVRLAALPSRFAGTPVKWIKHAESLLFSALTRLAFQVRYPLAVGVNN